MLNRYAFPTFCSLIILWYIPDKAIARGWITIMTEHPLWVTLNCYVNEKMSVTHITSHFHSHLGRARHHRSWQRMHYSAACASCEMSTADNSNHLPVGLLHPYRSYTVFLYIRPTLHCSIPPPPQKKIAPFHWRSHLKHIMRVVISQNFSRTEKMSASKLRHLDAHTSFTRIFMSWIFLSHIFVSRI